MAPSQPVIYLEIGAHRASGQVMRLILYELTWREYDMTSDNVGPDTPTELIAWLSSYQENLASATGHELRTREAMSQPSSKCTKKMSSGGWAICAA